MSDSRVGEISQPHEPDVAAEVLVRDLDYRRAIFRANRGWIRKILTRIRDYSLSTAVTYALARFHAVRTAVRTCRRLTRRFAPRRRLVESGRLVPGPSIAEIVGSVDADAWSVGPSLNERAVLEILDFISNCEFMNCGLPPHVRFRLRDRAKVERQYETTIAFADAAEPMTSGTIRDIVADTTLNAIAEHYFGYPAVHIQARILASFATEVAATERLNQKQTIFYHYDLDDYHMLIFNFYLTRVHEHSGPHILLPGTHRAKKAAHLFSSLNFPDDEIRCAYPGGEALLLRGHPGFGFVEDPFCLHKADAPIANDRYMLQLRFM